MANTTKMSIAFVLMSLIPTANAEAIEVNPENPWEGLTTKWETEYPQDNVRPYIESDDLVFHVLSPYSNNLLLIDPIGDTFWPVPEEPDEMFFYAKEEYDVPGYVSHNGREFVVKDIWSAWFHSPTKRLKFPDTLESILSAVCIECPNLEEVDFGNSFKKIGRHSFYNVPSLSRVKLPDVLNYIENECFVNCGFEKIEFNNQLMCILGNSFTDCANLKEVELPISLRLLGENAFNNCTSLEKVTINSTFINSFKNAFSNCPSIQEIHISKIYPPELNGSFNSIDKERCYVYVPKGSLTIYRQSWGKTFLPLHILEEGTEPSAVQMTEESEKEKVLTYTLDGLRIDNSDAATRGVLIQKQGSKSIKIIR